MTGEDNFWSLHETPVGAVVLAMNGEGALTHLQFAGRFAVPRGWRRDDACFDVVRRQLDEYFTARRQRFDIALAPHGTAFQRRVWQALCDIPFGQTITYAELARRVGKPGAARAVGQANGANPIAIIIPCHRVVAAGGIGGYAGGLEIKRKLLALEGIPLSS